MAQSTIEPLCDPAHKGESSSEHPGSPPALRVAAVVLFIVGLVSGRRAVVQRCPSTLFSACCGWRASVALTAAGTCRSQRQRRQSASEVFHRASPAYGESPAPAGEVLTVATQLGCVRRLLAMFAAVLTVRAGLRDDTVTGRVGAFVGIGHRDLLRKSPRLHYGLENAGILSPIEQSARRITGRLFSAAQTHRRKAGSSGEAAV
jgi:hypothetical protein